MVVVVAACGSMARSDARVRTFCADRRLLRRLRRLVDDAHEGLRRRLLRHGVPSGLPLLRRSSAHRRKRPVQRQTDASHVRERGAQRRGRQARACVCVCVCVCMQRPPPARAARPACVPRAPSSTTATAAAWPLPGSSLRPRARAPHLGGEARAVASPGLGARRHRLARRPARAAAAAGRPPRPVITFSSAPIGRKRRARVWRRAARGAAGRRGLVEAAEPPGRARHPAQAAGRPRHGCCRRRVCAACGMCRRVGAGRGGASRAKNVAEGAGAPGRAPW